MQQTQDYYLEQLKYQIRCTEAIDHLKLFMQDAKDQLKTSINISTLELIVNTVGESPEAKSKINDPDMKELSVYVP